jgi:DNA-binding IclR family transcriptional regulator
MTRPSPAVDRTVTVLEFLAGHPETGFGVSELARRLSMSKATVHAITAALADAGWLLRHPTDKTYRLGPALVAVGNAAAAQFEVVDYARVEMRKLAEDLGVQCVASAAIGDEMVILATAGATQPLGPGVHVGHRIPLVPPLGTVFVAWSDADEIERWLRRLGPSANEVDLARYREALATVRRRGYAVALEADARVQLERALAQMGDDPRARRVRKVVAELVEELGHSEYVLLELEHAASYRVSLIASPVFGADGSVVLALTVFGFEGVMSADQVPEYGERLRETTRMVTKAIHGSEPDA